MLIDIGYLLLVILGAPWLVLKMLMTGKYRRGLARRLDGPYGHFRW